MDTQRLGEIALTLIKRQVAKSGLQIQNAQRELGNIAAETGIPRDELNEFFLTILPDLINEMLGGKYSVNIKVHLSKERGND